MKGISESKSKLLRKSWKRRSEESYSVLPCRRFSLPEIKTATNNLDGNLLIFEGAYGYGKVYKGLIDNRTISVAIRTVNIKSWSGLDGLMKEVVLLCQLRHPNVVRLIGYCVEDDDKGFLVFEFIVNGTLGDRLYGTNHHEPLSWKQRLQICIGVARALHYLHSGVKHSIIHRNVKISNILLDEKLEAKLIDFGDCKMGPPSLSKDLLRIESEEVVGTLGYLDPDYFFSKVLTDKSDVYSFGVVLLQVLCGRKAAERELERDQIDPAFWPQICVQEGTFNQIIDPYLMGKIAPECFMIYMDIATSCVRFEGKDRPTMGEVEVILEKALELQVTADAARNDVDPGSDQYNYPVLEYAFSASLLERKESISDWSSTTSAELSLDISVQNPNGQ